MRSLILFLGIVLLTAHPIFAGEKKPLPVTIRLHGEGNEREGESFVTQIELVNPQKKIFIRKVPVLNERDIKAFLPFPGRDGMIGAYFVLDPHGADKLLQFTTESRGQLATVMINGRVAAAMRVETPVKDGIFLVPGGILPSEIVRLEQAYPIIGRESEFGKKKPKPEKEKKTPAQ
ncbi:MAG: hypothetical protein ACOYNN_10765 [Terrimicrobiaceae bacterium]|jgi:hypothetical protein